MLRSVVKNYWPYLLLLLLSAFIVWPSFMPGFFSHHDDLQVMRIYEMRRCFEDLQIPCRWVPDMGFGNGFPLFNYYSVLPYYIGAVLSYIFGFVGASKTLFAIPLILGGIGMYLLGKEMFGKLPGLAAGVLYLYAPYRALDSYTRGAIAESFALALAPFVFYFFTKLVRVRNISNFAGSTISLGLFLLCHNLMTLVFIPTLGAWIIFLSWLKHAASIKLLKKGKGLPFILDLIKDLQPVIIAGLLGIGLASFFIIPGYFEQNLVQINTLTQLGSDFRAHFVTVNQLFIDRSWGYGSSEFGPNDTISFQIGLPLWPLALLGFAASLFFVKKDFKKSLLGMFLTVLFLGSAFMTHERSIFVWKLISPLKFMQFPWRLLSLTIFSASLLAALHLTYIEKRKLHQTVAVAVIVVLTVLLNWQFFKPSTFYYGITDKDKLTGKLFEIQQQAGILDYLPKTAEEPKAPRPDRPEVISGSAEVGDFTSKSNSFAFDAVVAKDANIEIPVFDFPNWKVRVNGKDFSHSNQNKLGRIRLDLGPGEYKVEGRFYNTPLRTAANTISLVSLLLLIHLVWRRKLPLLPHKT